jgi:mono/diheme cytochrome c family protein
MKRPFFRTPAGRRGLLGLGVFASALLVAACSVEFENLQAAKEAERLANPAGSVYAGWRVFQDKCARCHGAGATGTANAPDLLPSVRDMGSRQFLSLVLQRYDWNQQAPQARSDIGARDAAIDVIMQRKEVPLTMPAWQGEPSVDAHILDLYAWLSARAQGTLGAGRPAP